MGGAPEAAARGGEPADGTRLISSQARQVKPKRPKAAGAEGSSGKARDAHSAPEAGGFGRTRTDARVDELPPEARGAIDRMLAEDGCTYQRIADALGKMGFAIKPSAVGRHEAKKTADERMEALFDRQLDALSRWMERQSGFDAAGAALKLVIGKLGRRLGEGGDLFADLPADKAAAGLIQAARAAIQYEKTAGERKRLRTEARAEAVKELREALKRAPEVWERIEALVAEDG